MKVSLDKDVAEDLIRYKLRNVQNQMNTILQRWNETSAEVFLEKAKNGTYSEAENDAIDLKQLFIEETNLKELLKSI